MNDKISVITVVYNDASGIRETMESFFSQTWEAKEYIVIDGGSTDGTADIVREYADRIAYWCSEPDGGLYDAMNKGIGHSTGRWINILNSGDIFCSPDSLRILAEAAADSDAAIIYGDAIADDGCKDDYIESGKDLQRLEYEAIYRHGCSLMRTDVHRQFLYDVSKTGEYGFALDFDAIYRMYHSGQKFKRVAAPIQKYKAEGASADIYGSLKYNYRITTQYGKSKAKRNYYVRRLLTEHIKHTSAYKCMKVFMTEYFLNSILPHLPVYRIRNIFYKLAGLRIGKDSVIDRKNYFIAPRRLVLGNNSHINRNCLIDARGGLTIGNSVSISHNVSIVSGGHDINSRDFHGKYYPIHIDDYVWVGVGATILQNVTIGRGAVVCAGAVVTRDVAPYDIVGGVPARKIGQREKDLDYKCQGRHPLNYYI